VKSLSLSAVRWLVVIVVIYTSLNMLFTARRDDVAAEAIAPTPSLT
jgi:hypothetical protein